jgi:hypothetical protein
MPSFRAKLIRWNGPAAWHFVTVPDKHAPPPTEGWGRTPVRATVDGVAWDTSVWWDTKTQSTLLAVPKKIRNGKGEGDMVKVTLEHRES